MKRLFAIFLPACVLLAGIIFFNNMSYSTVAIEVEKTQSTLPNGTLALAESPSVQTKTEREICVYIDGQTQKMNENDYLACVLAGEISPKSEVEALKAQVVAARTYLYNKILCGGCNKGDGDICADYKHCQAFKSLEKMREQWGENFEEYFDKIMLAVTKTEDEVILYNQKPINALYHSSSSSKTEDCASVFGGIYPYLVSVESSEKTSEDKTVNFSKEEFLQKVNAYFDLSLPEIEIKILSYTDSGRVSNVMLGNKVVKATALRTCLGLRSTDFTFCLTKNGITFSTLGYGHGVGMSQEGAKQMAEDGKSYKQILTHYYSGVSIEKYKL